jgi:hypothetical protein
VLTVVMPRTITLHAMERAVQRTTLTAHQLIELSKSFETMDGCFVWERKYGAPDQYELVCFKWGSIYKIIYDARNKTIITFLPIRDDFGKLYDLVARTSNIYEIREYAIRHQIHYITYMMDQTINYIQKYLL